MDAETRKNKKLVNDALYNIGLSYHRALPLQEIDDTLQANGFQALEEAIYCGRSGSIHEAVGRGFYLSMQWYQMESGRYEVVAYLN